MIDPATGHWQTAFCVCQRETERHIDPSC